MDASGCHRCVMGITEGRGATRGAMESLRRYFEGQWMSPPVVREYAVPVTQLEQESRSCIQVATGQRGERDRSERRGAERFPLWSCPSCTQCARLLGLPVECPWAKSPGHVPAGFRCDTGTSPLYGPTRRKAGQERRRDEG